MLVQFSVDNFLSFDEEQIFSMVATGGDQHPKHLVPNLPRKDEYLLRAAAVYGANGAGKSNLALALRFAKNLITQGSRSKTAIPVRPFKLSFLDHRRPSKFEFVINIDGVIYNYGFRLDSKRVREEWLHATPKTKEVKYFERVTSEDGKTEVEFGPSFRGRDAERHLFLKFIAQSLKPTQLFLSKAVEDAAEDNALQLQPVFDWFDKALLVLTAEARPNNLEVLSHFDRHFMAFLTALLKAAGTGIDEVKTREIPFDFQKSLPDLSEDECEEIRERVASTPEDEIVRVEQDNGEIFWLTQGEEGQPVRLILVMQHRAKDGRHVNFTMNEQSEGTQRLINLALALFMFKNNPVQVLVLDELDRRLHTHLSRLFVQAALECDDEHRQSQLIFTTHDTNLLDLELLRRDEIWFVEKDNDGASHVYSLAEFKIRPDLRIEKGYLSGRFGAIPFIGSMDGLFCGEDEDIESDTKTDAPQQLVAAAA